MGATSVTGTGLGSADGSNKGSEHMTLGTSHLIGPHIVQTGTATVGGGGSVTINIPTLAGSASDYLAMVCDTAGTPAAASVFGLSTSTLTLHGTAAHVLYWMIFKTGVNTK